MINFPPSLYVLIMLLMAPLWAIECESRGLKTVEAARLRAAAGERAEARKLLNQADLQCGVSLGVLRVIGEVYREIGDGALAAVYDKAAERKVVEQEKEAAVQRSREERRLYLESKRPDTDDEAAFRRLVRNKLENPSGYSGPSRGLTLLGQDAYSLDELASSRVVHQEVQRRGELAGRLERYREALAALIANDKTLDATERQHLDSLAQRLELQPEDAAAIESTFAFQDRSPKARKEPK